MDTVDLLTAAPVAVHFPQPMPGVGVTDGTLDVVDGSGGLLWQLTASGGPADGLTWVCADPSAFRPDFTVDIDADAAAVLGDDLDALHVLVIVNATDPARPTGNYLAPIVVNTTTGTAMQVLQGTGRWAVDEPLADEPRT